MVYTFLKLVILLTLFSGIWERYNKIAITNRLKLEASKYYNNKEYKKSAILYDSLISYYRVEDEKIQLNLAHSLFLVEDRKKASEHYKLLISSVNKEISSIAFQQLGLISAFKGKTEEAISYFKKSLKTNPSNQNARYNLELIKKLQLIENESSKKSGGKGNQKQQSSGEKNPQGTKQKEGSIDQASDKGNNQKEKGDQEDQGGMFDESESGEEIKGPSNEGTNEDETDLKKDEKGNKDEEDLRIRRLAEINMSQEKARIILEEMKNQEIQYIQQLKKHQYNKEYKGKPDW